MRYEGMSHSNQSLKHNTSAVTDSCVAHLIQVQGQSMTSSGGFSGCIMETLTIVNNSPPWYMASPLLPPPAAGTCYLNISALITHWNCLKYFPESVTSSIMRHSVILWTLKITDIIVVFRNLSICFKDHPNLILYKYNKYVSILFQTISYSLCYYITSLIS